MLPSRSHATSAGRLKLDPGVPVPGVAPPRPLPPPAPAPPAPDPAPPPAGCAGRTPIASGFRPSTSATRPDGSNLITWLAAASIVQTLSEGSTRKPIAALNP